MSDNSRNKLILVSSIIFLQITPGLWKNIPLLDEVNYGEIVSTRHAINFSISDSCPTQVITVLILNINSASSSAETSVGYTIRYQHTSEKEVAKEGGIYNRTVRVYCNIKLPNVRI